VNSVVWVSSVIRASPSRLTTIPVTPAGPYASPEPDTVSAPSQGRCSAAVQTPTGPATAAGRKGARHGARTTTPASDDHDAAAVALALGGLGAVPAQAAAAGGDGPGIIGGTEASQGEFPWMVQLSMGCGGALFTPSLVLTAAHCFGGRSGPQSVTVTAGTVDRLDPAAITRTGDYATVASGYSNAVNGDDWALLRLNSPINGVPVLKIATNNSYQSGTFTVMGWGATSEGGALERYLHEANVDFINDTDCGNAYPDMNTAEEICAGNLANGGVDTCQGDSGGPMVKRNASNEWVQVGITSWGQGCGEAGFPGVYTEVNVFANDICNAAAALTGCPYLHVTSPPGNVTCPLGSFFVFNLTASGGGSPYVWTVYGLPPGLSYNSATGQIAGFLGQGGSYLVTYYLDDGMSPTVMGTFWITVTVPVPDLSGSTQSGASSTLQANGLVLGTVGTITVWDSSDGGRVVGQFPSAGTQVTLGSSVNITIGRWGGANR
jgi:hypothetical protein